MLPKSLKASFYSIFTKVHHASNQARSAKNCDLSFYVLSDIEVLTHCKDLTVLTLNFTSFKYKCMAITPIHCYSAWGKKHLKSFNFSLKNKIFFLLMLKWNSYIFQNLIIMQVKSLFTSLPEFKCKYTLNLNKYMFPETHEFQNSLPLAKILICQTSNYYSSNNRSGNHYFLTICLY